MKIKMFGKDAGKVIEILYLNPKELLAEGRRHNKTSQLKMRGMGKFDNYVVYRVWVNGECNLISTIGTTITESDFEELCSVVGDWVRIGNFDLLLNLKERESKEGEQK